MTSKSRKNYIDELRGFAIFLVVIGHAYRTNYNYSLHEFLNYLDSAIYMFHMPLFFFVSGLTFYTKGDVLEKGGTYFRRAVSLLIPTLIWMALQLFFNLTIDGQVELFVEKYSQALIRPFQQFWFMYALIIILGISTFIYSTNKTLNVLIFVLLYSWVYLNGENGFFNTIAWGLAFFYMGVVLKDAELKKLTLLSFVLFVIIFSSYFLEPKINKLLVSSFIVLLLFLFFKFKNVEFKFLAILGLASISIYFTHVIIRDAFYLIYPGNIYVFSAVVTCFGLILPLYLQRILPKRMFKFEVGSK